MILQRKFKEALEEPVVGDVIRWGKATLIATLVIATVGLIMMIAAQPFILLQMIVEEVFVTTGRQSAIIVSLLTFIAGSIALGYGIHHHKNSGIR